MVVAGGETSGAVVSALDIERLRIGADIDPGVPWTYAEGSGPPLLLALKSGNFGGPHFFRHGLYKRLKRQMAGDDLSGHPLSH